VAIGLRRSHRTSSPAPAPGLGFAHPKPWPPTGARLVILQGGGATRKEESIPRAAAERGGKNVVGIPSRQRRPESAERAPPRPRSPVVCTERRTHQCRRSADPTALDTRGPTGERLRQRLPRWAEDRSAVRRGPEREGTSDENKISSSSRVGEARSADWRSPTGIARLAMVAKTLARRLGPDGTRVNA